MVGDVANERVETTGGELSTKSGELFEIFDCTSSQGAEMERTVATTSYVSNITKATLSVDVIDINQSVQTVPSVTRHRTSINRLYSRSGGVVKPDGRLA